MGNNHQGHCAAALLAALLDNRFDADILFTQDTGNAGQHPRLIQHGEAEIVGAVELVHGSDAASRKLIRQIAQGRDAADRAAGDVAGNIHHICGHGAASGHLARAQAVKQDVSGWRYRRH